MANFVFPNSNGVHVRLEPDDDGCFDLIMNELIVLRFDTDGTFHRVSGVEELADSGVAVKNGFLEQDKDSG